MTLETHNGYRHQYLDGAFKGVLDHANHQSTARYAHLDNEHLLDAAQQVGNTVQSLSA